MYHCNISLLEQVKKGSVSKKTNDRSHLFTDASLLVLITKFTFNSTFLTTSGQSLY